MKKHTKVLLFLSIALCGIATAQVPNEIEGESSVFWGNASPAAGIKFILQGKKLTDAWLVGANGGGGSTPTLSWNASFSVQPPLLGFSRAFKLANRESIAALLIGDFKKFTSEEIALKFPDILEKIPDGFTKTSSNSFTRAALLSFLIQKESSAKYPLHLVNGIPDASIRITFQDGKSFVLSYAKPEIYLAETKVRTKLGIQEGVNKEVQAFSLDPLMRGAVLAFYRKPGQTELGKLFMKLESIESIEYRANNPEPEEEEESE
jgi:hypothetical protein